MMNGNMSAFIGVDRRRRHCRYEWITRRGSQFVKFQFKRETKNVNFDLIATPDSVANFSGSKTTTDKVYHYQEACF